MTALDRLVARRDRSKYRLVQALKRQRLLGQPVTCAAGPVLQIRGQPVINFTASNYLGLTSLAAVRRAVGWSANHWGIALSQPRLWASDDLSTRLEEMIAAWVGQERALLFPSTHQLAMDILPLLAGKNGLILIDEWAYPISMAGAQAAAQGGARISVFRHNDPNDLARLLESKASTTDKVIVCDGLYPSVGEPAALPAFQRLASEFDAVIYVDDAQGVGLLGRGPRRAAPYGSGGGGTPQYWNLNTGRLLHASSLAKAIGVPVAFVAGPARFIEYLACTSFTHLHASPPALPVLASGLAALRLHAHLGDRLRSDLVSKIRYFHDQLSRSKAGRVSNHLYPMQSMYLQTPSKALAVAQALRMKGVWSIVQFNPPEYPSGGAVRWIITTLHTHEHLDRLVEGLAALSS